MVFHVFFIGLWPPMGVGEDAFFLPSFLCDAEDQGVMARLREELELEGKDLIDWHGARHLGRRKGLETPDLSSKSQVLLVFQWFLVVLVYGLVTLVGATGHGSRRRPLRERLRWDGVRTQGSTGAEDGDGLRGTWDG